MGSKACRGIRSSTTAPSSPKAFITVSLRRSVAARVYRMNTYWAKRRCKTTSCPSSSRMPSTVSSRGNRDARGGSGYHPDNRRQKHQTSKLGGVTERTLVQRAMLARDPLDSASVKGVLRTQGIFPPAAKSSTAKYYGLGIRVRPLLRDRGRVVIVRNHRAIGGCRPA